MPFNYIQPRVRKAMSEDTAVKGFQAPSGKFVEEQTGMPPYWTPDEEAHNEGVIQGFYARVIGRDDGDPAFPRFVLQAGQDMTAMQGGGDDAHEVDVPKGGFFTCSVYAGLPLERYIGIPVIVQVKAKRAINTKQGRRTIWDWTLRVPESAQKILDERRQRAAEAAISQGAAMRSRGLPATNGSVPQLGAPPVAAAQEEIPF